MLTDFPLNQINDMLDEALDDSQGVTDEGPTPPKMKRRTSTSPSRRASSPSGTSAASWEYEATPSRHKDFKTPRIDGLTASPQVRSSSLNLCLFRSDCDLRLKQVI